MVIHDYILDGSLVYNINNIIYVYIPKAHIL